MAQRQMPGSGRQAQLESFQKLLLGERRVEESRKKERRIHHLLGSPILTLKILMAGTMTFVRFAMKEVNFFVVTTKKKVATWFFI
jgi:hypothetical protein